MPMPISNNFSLVPAFQPRLSLIPFGTVIRPLEDNTVDNLSILGLTR